jgi:hypothetical protein
LLENLFSGQSIPEKSTSTSSLVISHLNKFIEDHQEDVRNVLEKIIDVPLPAGQELPIALVPFDSDLAIFAE